MFFNPRTMTFLLSGGVFWAVYKSTNGGGIPKPEITPHQSLKDRCE
jgi:hypothetical protein